jgi:hypothetical protein
MKCSMEGYKLTCIEQSLFPAFKNNNTDFFFNSRCLLHKELIPQGQGQTVNQDIYKGVLESLCESI